MAASSAGGTVAAAFVLGVFCAYWAQGTARNAWLWFFFGLFLPPVAGLALLWLNARDRPALRTLQEIEKHDVLLVRKDMK